MRSVPGLPGALRTGWTGELGFEIYTRPGMDYEALWAHVSAAGARHGMLDIGLDGMDIRRIEAAIFNNGSDIDHTMSAWAAGLGPFVDLTKSDFFGRDALEATTDRRPRIYGIACKAAEPLTGGPVARNGREIGHITASGWSPFLERGVAFVRLAHANDLARVSTRSKETQRWPAPLPVRSTKPVNPPCGTIDRLLLPTILRI